MRVKHAPRLRHQGQTPLDDDVGAESIEPLALQRYRAAPWLDQAKDGLHGRGLTGGIGSKQADNLTLVHLNRDVMQDLAGPVGSIDTL